MQKKFLQFRRICGKIYLTANRKARWLQKMEKIRGKPLTNIRVCSTICERPDGAAHKAKRTEKHFEKSA